MTPEHKWNRIKIVAGISVSIVAYTLLYCSYIHEVNKITQKIMSHASQTTNFAPMFKNVEEKFINCEPCRIDSVRRLSRDFISRRILLGARKISNN